MVNSSYGDAFKSDLADRELAEQGGESPFYRSLYPGAENSNALDGIHAEALTDPGGFDGLHFKIEAGRWLYSMTKFFQRSPDDAGHMADRYFLRHLLETDTRKDDVGSDASPFREHLFKKEILERDLSAEHTMRNWPSPCRRSFR